MRWSAASLPEVLDAIWRQWREAVNSTDHPLRLGVLATRSSGGVSQRMLVLRDCDRAARTMTSYTDARSLKVREIRADDRVGWHFYDAIERVQIRIEGTIAVHLNDELALRCWSNAPVANKRNYLSALPPGTELSEHLRESLSGSGEPQEPDYNHFCVLVTTVHRIDWLWVTEPEHRRCRFVFEEHSRDFRGTWVSP